MFHWQGARKKKRLTDRVKIIPFPNQNLRDKVKKAPATVIAKKDSKNMMVKPPPKVMEAPSGQLSNSSISIKKMMEKSAAVEDAPGVDRATLPRESYNFDDLKMEWRKFAFSMKNEGKETVYNAMIKRDPKRMPDDNYVMEVDNQVQIDYIQPYLSDLLDHLRKALKNFDILIQVEITSNLEQEVKYQTGKDKFNALARKNPNLHTLKNTFNLDIEF